MQATELKSFAPYSYRHDAAIPAFPDDKAVMIIDGHCVLCTGGAARMMKWDRQNKFRYLPAQSPLGLAILKHYRIDWDETYLLLDNGTPYIKSGGYLKIAEILGGAWFLTRVFLVIPEGLRNRLYDFIARNRYKWFGTTGYCSLLPEEYKDRVLKGEMT